MYNRKRLIRDHLQNLLILLLSVSAVYLFTLTQSGPLNLQLPQISFSSTAAEESQEGISHLQELDWPVTLVVCDTFGDRRYQQLSTADSAFTSVEGLWADLLSGGISAVSVTLADFQQALSLPGIYVCFPTPIPLCVLSERLGLASTDETPLQRLLLTADGNSVRFFFCDGTRYFLSRTDLLAEEVSATADILSGQDCNFAFEQEDSPLHPLTVLPADLPTYTSLSTISGAADHDALLGFFGFNAHTTNRYIESSGTEVIVEAPRKFSIATDGHISYLGSASYAPENLVLSEQLSPALPDLVDGAYGLISRLSALCGNGTQLFLSHAEYDRSSSTCLLRFSYMADGLPLISGDGEAAAELLIENGVVVECSFLCRSYTLADTSSLLLPVPQASAIAAQYQGMEMALSYVDGGGDNVSVSWLMR